MKDSVLKIERPGKLPIAFPARSNRGVQQRIYPYVSGELIEVVSGAHRDGTRHLSRKFGTEFSCNDFFAPGFAGLWEGEEVILHCCKPVTQTLDAQAAAGAEVRLIRPIADDAVPRGILPTGKLLPALTHGNDAQGGRATFAQPVHGVMFCPRLVCLVETWDDLSDEWEVTTDWRASAIEKRGY